MGVGDGRGRGRRSRVRCMRGRERNWPAWEWVYVGMGLSGMGLSGNGPKWDGRCAGGPRTRANAEGKAALWLQTTRRCGRDEVCVCERERECACVCVCSSVVVRGAVRWGWLAINGRAGDVIAESGAETATTAGPAPCDTQRSVQQAAAPWTRTGTACKNRLEP